MATKLVKLNDDWFCADGHPNTRIHRLARVAESATIRDAAVVGSFCIIGDYAVVKDAAVIGGHARQLDGPSALAIAWYDDRPLAFRGARVYGTAVVAGEAMVSGSSDVSGSSLIEDRAVLTDNATVISSHVQHGARVTGDGIVMNSSSILNAATVSGGAYVCGGTLLGEAPHVSGFTRWPIQMCSEDTFRIGCQTHTFEQWCRPRKDTPVPWDDHNVSESSEAAIKDIITLMMRQSIANNTWKRSKTTTDQPR